MVKKTATAFSAILAKNGLATLEYLIFKKIEATSFNAIYAINTLSLGKLKQFKAAVLVG